MPKNSVEEKVYPNFGLEWDQKTGRFFPNVGTQNKGNTGKGLNAGRFGGPYGLEGKKNSSFSESDLTVDDLIDSVVSGNDPKSVIDSGVGGYLDITQETFSGEDNLFPEGEEEEETDES